MSHQFFDESMAEAYDQRFIKLAALRDTLLLVARLGLNHLPDDARILCVGAGTGAEILHFADAFPGWRFTAVDPSGPMLARCRKRAADQGVGERITYHEGTTDTLAPTEPFDAATSILVSQFVVDKNARTAFFRAIADRLKPGAPLVVADLALPKESDAPLRELWKRAWMHADVPREQVEKMFERFGTDVAVIDPSEIAEIIKGGGFDEPLRCYQSILIHGWLTNRTSTPNL